MANLFSPPQTFELPLSFGGDLLVDFVHKIDDAVADYPSGASVTLTIETSPVTEVDAAITDEHAVVLLDKAEANMVPSGKKWRAVISYSDGTDVVMCNGKTVRKDGG